MYNTLFISNSSFLPLNMALLPCMLLTLWPARTRQTSVVSTPKSTIFNQILRTTMASMGGAPSLITAMFLGLLAANLLGLVPYTFSVSSHLILTLSLGLPAWLSLILSSATFNPKKTIAHLLPDGAPDWLNPFLVLIETTSVFVRPLTLSFRLAANMSAGHIVLSLVGIYCSAALFSSPSGSAMLVIASSAYTLFEVAICLIQAYIFCLLLTLYSDDHAH